MRARLLHENLRYVEDGIAFSQRGGGQFIREVVYPSNYSFNLFKLLRNINHSNLKEGGRLSEVYSRILVAEPACKTTKRALIMKRSVITVS